MEMFLNVVPVLGIIPFSFAAFAVLTFAFVATVIPKYPASVENTAPTTKQTAVIRSLCLPVWAEESIRKRQM